MDKPFEVGEWVWVWPIQKWARIVSVVERNGLIRVEVEQYEKWFSDDISRDPIIPPKPKKTVTKEAKRASGLLYSALCSTEYVSIVAHNVPLDAKNVRCTYDIEE